MFGEGEGAGFPADRPGARRRSARHAAKTAAAPGAPVPVPSVPGEAVTAPSVVSVGWVRAAAHSISTQAAFDFALLAMCIVCIPEVVLLS